MGKIEEHEGQQYLMVDKVLDKINKIKGIEKFDETKIFIDTDDKLSDDIALKNVVKLMTSVTKDDGKFYLQLFLEQTLFVK